MTDHHADGAGRGHHQDQQAHHHHLDVGSVGEEAAKLLGALGDWAKDQGQSYAGAAAAGASSASEAVREVDRHLATGSAECRYCPICLVVSRVRATSPEVRAHLSQASTSLLAAVAGMLATPVPDDAGRRGPVEHIDLEDPPADHASDVPTDDPGAQPAGESADVTGRDDEPLPWWASTQPHDDGEERRPRRTRRACTDQEEEPR